VFIGWVWSLRGGCRIEKRGREESGPTCRILVSMVAAVTMQSLTVCLTISVTLTLKIVAHPREGTARSQPGVHRGMESRGNQPGPKLVANRFAKKVNKLFATAGAGEVAPVNKASFSAIKIPDSAYRWQYVTPDAFAASAAWG
jgi:hypothetical protein